MSPQSQASVKCYTHSSGALLRFPTNCPNLLSPNRYRSPLVHVHVVATALAEGFSWKACS